MIIIIMLDNVLVTAVRNVASPAVKYFRNHTLFRRPSNVDFVCLLCDGLVNNERVYVNIRNVVFHLILSLDLRFQTFTILKCSLVVAKTPVLLPRLVHREPLYTPLPPTDVRSGLVVSNDLVPYELMRILKSGSTRFTNE